MSPLPGGSPGPHAHIPAPWRGLIIAAGSLATLALGFVIRAALLHADEEKGKSLEQWSLDWSRNHKE